MMRGLVSFWYLARESFLFLRRDRIFFPMLLVGTAIAYFANLASTWTFEEWDKVLFDIGLAGFRLTGGMVAILWGVRMISDPMTDRSIELRIAAPSARYTWILARYAGLSFSLIIMGSVFIGAWQGLMLLNKFGTMTNLQNWSLGLIVCEWLVLGALGMLTATITNFSTAVFITIAAWITGLIAPLVAATLSPETEPLHRKFIETLANVWNFQRFNMIERLHSDQLTVRLDDLIPRLSWGASVLVGCLILAAWIFQKKDLT